MIFSTKLNSNKCHLFQDRIDLLGFSVSKDGILPMDDKVDKIMNFPRPVNETGIRAFVNLAGFYRRHVNNFATIVIPLTNLLKKTNPLVWSEACELAFNSLKEVISRMTLLNVPDPSQPFHVYTDASHYAVGATLAQRKDGVNVPICFLSRRLQGAELRYSILEKELIAVI